MNLDCMKILKQMLSECHKAVVEGGPFPIKKRENTMIIRPTFVYMVMVSEVFLFAGCSFWANEPQRGAGTYKDVGYDGSIKPHPESSYGMSQEPQRRTDGEIILGGTSEVPDMRTGTTKRETGSTTLPSGPSPNSTSSSNRPGGGTP
jgi:hypothetical protein